MRMLEEAGKMPDLQGDPLLKWNSSRIDADKHASL